jgi:serine phosphatase RsbU (regulator of sigma subunit)
MSLFDGEKYYDFEIKDDGYIRNSILSDGISIGDSLYVFSTLDGGAVVIDKDTREAKIYINNQNGLPDDEIYAMAYDKSGGLWLSHQFGLTRADLNLPLGDFSVYPGLKGNLTTSLRHNNELYVATSEGVFYLSRVKNFTIVEALTRNEIVTRPEIRPVPQLSQQVTVQLAKPDDSPDVKRKLLPRIFAKKTVPVNQPVFIRPVESEVPTISNAPLVKYSWKKVSKLKSVDFMYKKIGGLNEKCRQLVSTKQGILAATNRGLFIINKYKAELISENRYINLISWQPLDDKYSVAAGDGYFLTSFKNKKWTIEVPDIHFTEPVYSIIQTDEKTLWMGGENIAYRADFGSYGVTYSRFRIDVDYPQRYFLNSINDTVFLFTETGISFFDVSSGGFLKYFSLPAISENVKIGYPLSNIPLMKYGDNWIYMEKNKMIRDKDILIFKLFDEIVSVTNEKSYLWIVDRENRLFGINRKRSLNMIPETKLLVKNIQNERGTSFDFSNIVFTRGENEIHFKIVTPVYLKENITQYQYFINKNMKDWSEWSPETNYSRLIPESGDYTLQIRAKDLWGDIGEPVSIRFTIKAPFTKTSLFYILVVFAALIMIFVFFRFREKQLHEKNRILEKKVKERTAEIEAQKGEITSSIQYASRIQHAMLPMNDLFKESFSDFFIIFKPRSIVSGDFYWIAEDEKNIFLTVADCTGHGVPGAFMSALGISILNEIVIHNKDLQANIVLNLLRERIKNSLHQTGKEGEAADGMDISLCIIRKNRKLVQFSGAFNPLFIVTGGQLIEYKGDRMPIGIHYGEEASFSNFEINIRKGDVIYMLSDGLTDQFGGPESEKFKKSNLRKLLSDIHGNPMSDQKKKIEFEFEKWKGKSEQIDDITFIGIRI